MSNSSCPEPHQLRTYVLGPLSPLEAEYFAQHLEECSSCATQVEMLLESDELVAAFRQGAAAPVTIREADGVSIRRLQQLGNTPGEVETGKTIKEDRRIEPAVASGTLPVIPGYAIQSKLGHGGMGVVYEAEHLALKRKVALKVILAGTHADTEGLARFRGEAEAVARLHHPNIVQVYEIGECAGLPYFAMEYVSGGTLDRKLSGTPQPADRAAQMLELLARAMQAAHERGVIHRDLKPANVLLTDDGTPRIADFGLARRLDDPARRTASGAIMGTPSYMSPEQAAGRTGQVGPLSDVYALGAILYEMLTGRPPFKAATEMDTLLQVLGQEPVPPRRLNAQVPRDPETICLKCLEKQAGRRYASAKDLADDLRRFQEGKPIVARPVSVRERAVKWVKRRPAVAGLLAALLVALMTGLVVSTAFAIEAGNRAEEADANARRAEEKEKDADKRAEEADKARQETDRERQKVEGALKDLEIQKGKAVAEKKTAEEERDKAKFQQRRAETARHAIQIDQAMQAWEQDDVLKATRVLAQVPGPFQTTWEYRHVRGLCQRKGFTLTFTGQDDRVRSVAFSDDGKRFASASEDKAVKVWDAATGKEPLTLKGHTGEVTCVAFSAADKRLVSGSKDGTLKVWDTATGKELLTLKGHTGPVFSVAFSPDSKHLVSASEDKTVKVWDAATDKDPLTLKGHTGPVFSVAFSPDGKRLVSGSFDKTVKLWDAQIGKEVRTLKGHSGPVACVTFSADGKRLASGSRDFEDPRKMEIVLDRAGGKPIISGSMDLPKPGQVKVWDAATGQELHTLKGDTGPVSSVAFGADGKRLASGSWSGTVKVWDAATGQELRTLKGHSGTVTSVAFSAADTHIVSGSPDGTVIVWDPATSQELLTLQGHTDAIFSVALSADGKRIVSGAGLILPAGKPGEVKVWDATAGQVVRTLKGHTEEVKGVAFSANGKRIASASEDRTVKVWDPDTGQELLTLKGHTSGVKSVAFRPDGKRLASSGGYDETVKIWDATTGKEVRTLKDTRTTFSVAFSADGKRLASGSWGTVKVWDAATGQELLTLKGHTGPVFSVSFSADGKRIVSGSEDETVKVWDAATGQEAFTLKGHTGEVWSVAFSPDSKRIVSGGAGILKSGEVKMWDAATGQEVLALKGHIDNVFSVTFSADGKRIISGSWDRTVKVWEADAGAR
jgi:WD40 repeat protein